MTDLLNEYELLLTQKEPMDTTESMKSDTPQPATKEQSPQKEQIDNNIAGMSQFMNDFHSRTFVFFFFDSTFKAS